MSTKQIAELGSGEFSLPAGSVIHVDNGVPIVLVNEIRFRAHEGNEPRVAKYVEGMKGTTPSGVGSKGEGSVSKAEVSALSTQIEELKALLAAKNEASEVAKTPTAKK